MLFQIIDEALLCHVGFVDKGQPFVIPTLAWRIDETIFLHGSRGSRMLNVLRSGTGICVTFSLLDGLVMARSAFYHSANYLSAVVLGKARSLDSKQEKLQALEQFMERIAPRRWPQVRSPSRQELEATDVFALSLDEASVKVRAGDPGDPDKDLGFPVWAGTIPVRQVFGPMQDADNLDPAHAKPDYRSAFLDRWTER
jgi:hypothetical protein|tara:strand:+ start:1153 stop:1746 length:594 start_codon:yes stop_codon:yes gene_type:complete